ncbi:MAG: pyruvate dehydrogenase (acetyl-transferring) E1 component subunit alpha [bacterium]|nr:pyruvate dehydrogenase (acetyl-transferring) E1 component subunit alpha [bacterium]
MIERELAYKFLREMVLLRRFEERTAQAYQQGKIGGFCHLYIGQEAVAVGAINALRDSDYVLSAYRDHGHALAKGMSAREVMAELFGKVTGCSKGKGGSMHLFSKEKKFLGGNGIVGAQIPIATGVGWAIKYRKRDDVVLCFFGEGAINQGAFHESLNLASIWRLPVIYICENNRFGMGTPVERASSIYDLSQKAYAYDMARSHVDGMDVIEVYNTVNEAVARARGRSLPTLIEARTYRYRGHSMSDPIHGHYRTKEDVEEQKKHDPILNLKNYLIQNHLWDESDYQKIEDEVKNIVTDALQFSDSSPEPDDSELFTDIYTGEYYGRTHG